MRKNFGAKPWTLPQPVYIIGTYDDDGVPNAMNAAWGGISGDSEISFCLSKNHRTVKNLKANGDFTVSMATEDYRVECDYVGLVSGNDKEDKLERAGFTCVMSEHVNAPIICELPMTLECRMISYDDKTQILRGEILNVSADESILTEDGKIDVDKLHPLIFDVVNLSYRSLGDKVGKAFRDGKELIK